MMFLVLTTNARSASADGEIVVTDVLANWNEDVLNVTVKYDVGADCGTYISLLALTDSNEDNIPRDLVKPSIVYIDHFENDAHNGEISFPITSNRLNNAKKVYVWMGSSNSQFPGHEYGSSARKWNISFNLNNEKIVFGDGPVPQSIDSIIVEDGTASGSLFNTKLSASFYTFLGWDLNKDAATPSFTQIGSDGFDIVTSNKELFAVWQENEKFKLTYDANGGEGVMNDTGSLNGSDMYYGGETITVLENQFTPPGEDFVFNSWNVCSDGSGASYQKDSTLQMPIGELTLYAQWLDTSKFAVTYNGNVPIGENDVAQNMPINDMGAAPNSEYILSENIPSLLNYDFIGWATSIQDAQNGQVSYNAGSTVTTGEGGSGISLYAVWEAKEFEFNIVSNNGTVEIQDSNDTSYASGENLKYGVVYSLKAIAEEHYKFDSWLVSDDSVVLTPNKNSTDVSFKMTGKAVSITAKYIPKTPASISGSANVIFDKYEFSQNNVDLSFKFFSNDYSLNKIVLNSAVLTQNTDYTVSDNVYTIKKQILENLDEGTYVIEFDCGMQENPTKNISVVDTTPVVSSLCVSSNNAEYGTVSLTIDETSSPTQTNATSGSSIKINAYPNEHYKFVGWTVGGNISLNPSEIASQASFVMPKSSVTLVAEFEPKDIAVLSSGSLLFDKYEVGENYKDILIYFYENDYQLQKIMLGKNQLVKNTDYTNPSDGVYIIKKECLSGLSVGKVNLIFVCGMMSDPSCGIIVSDSGESQRYIILGTETNWDFEESNPKSNLYVAEPKNNGSITYEKIDNAHGKSAVLKSTAKTQGESPQLVAKRTIDNRGICVFETDYYVGTLHSRSIILVKTNTQDWLAALSMDAEGNFKYTNASGTSQLVNSDTKAQAGKWYRIKILLDTEEWIYTIYVDDELFVDNVKIKASGQTIDYLSFAPGTGSNDNVNIIAMDNMKLYYMARKFTYTYALYDIYGDECPVDDFSWRGGDIEIIFDSEIDETTIEGITVTDNIGKEVSYIGSFDPLAGIYTLSFENLQPNTNYKINFDNVKTVLGGSVFGQQYLSFKTNKADYCVYKYSLGDMSSIKDATPGQNVSLNVTIQNKKGQNRTSMIAAGIYDDSSLLDFETTIVSGSDVEKEYTLNFTAPQNVADCHIEIRLLNGPTDYTVIDMVDN